MASTHMFTFNPFQENTYVVFDETKECVIIDPGCFDDREKNELQRFISQNKLKPVLLLNTHSHIDHMIGNLWVTETFKIPFLMNENDLYNLNNSVQTGMKYGFVVPPSPQPHSFLNENDLVTFGNTKLKVLFTPGHSLGSISFYNEQDKWIICGDVIFKNSIGRYDFTGGNYKTLMESITKKLFELPSDTKVFSGHGPETTIGNEKKTNPYVLEYLRFGA